MPTTQYPDCSMRPDVFVLSSILIAVRVPFSFLCDPEIITKSCQNASQRGGGYPQERPERSKMAQGYPGTLQETLQRILRVLRPRGK